jgi:phosphoribosylformylglycinamidine (FGAM) synthase-like amidotransferase family enzyme
MILVLKGEGINCERETAAAFARLGAEARIMSVRELLANPSELLNARILALPGGFSYGDEIQSGHILGLALTQGLKDIWPEFIKRQGLAIGICNGFQTLMKMGVFEEKRTISLVHNSPHGFQDRWVKVNVRTSKCIWTKGLEGKTLDLPIRHGEGRVWSQDTSFETLDNMGQVALVYSQDVNGSMGKIAGLTDPTGQILGLMPHPEAALESWLMPDALTPQAHELNTQIFKNAVEFVSGVKS